MTASKNISVTKTMRGLKFKALPTWLIIAAIVIFFPLGIYLLWRQERWSKRTKKIAAGLSSGVWIVVITAIVIFAPPSLTVTSSLSPVKSEAYMLTGKISPSGSVVSINGVKAAVHGDTYSLEMHLIEGDNNLHVVVVSGDKRTEKDFKIHRYTKAEIVAMQKAEAKKNAAAAAKKAKAEATSAAAAEKKKAEADAIAARKKAAEEAAAKAKAEAAAAAAVTVSQKNAVQKAKDYLSYTAFSHDGLVEQLEYEKFSAADATYGADHSGADWNVQAAKKAKEYMSYSSFSRGSLIDQLEYEKFTPAQAAYGADSVGL